MTNDRSDKTFHPNRRGFLGVAAATSAGQPLMRMTFDVRENERKMSVYLSKKIDKIAKATGADIAPPTAPRKGACDSRVYQTTHVTDRPARGTRASTRRRPQRLRCAATLPLIPI